MRMRMRMNAVWILIMAMIMSLLVVPAYAFGETGQEGDVFRVILTIFGLDEDVVAIVTTDNGEASRVKFLDKDAPYVHGIPVNSTLAEGRGETSQFVEYVATFPNITVDTGETYNTCVVTIKDLEMICNTGQNSPASRPEFVDVDLDTLSSNATVTEETEETAEETDGEGSSEETEEEGD